MKSDKHAENMHCTYELQTETPQNSDTGNDQLWNERDQ